MKEGRDVWLDELTCPTRPGHMPVRADGQRGFAVPAVHLRLDRQAEGHRPHDRRLPARHATTHHYVFDLKPDKDVYWCAADVGWITGHSYIVYGPLCNAATSVMYEGTPDFPDKDRWWQIIERYGVTILYTAPTAIRAHMKWGPEFAEQARPVLAAAAGSVGEPINPEAWIWYLEHVGSNARPIVDTWWQTETGMIMITPLPGVTTTKPGLGDQAVPRRRCGRLRRDGRRGRPRRRRLSGAATAVAVDAARHLRR